MIRILWLALLPCFLCSCYYTTAPTNSQAIEDKLKRDHLFEKTQYTSESVLEIFQILHKLSPDNAKGHEIPTIETLNTIAQKNFLRPRGEERLSEAAIKHYQGLCKDLSPKQKERIIRLFREIGDIDEASPKRTNPDYILIQGSTVDNMRDRVMYVVEQLRSGKLKIDNAKIVFISGDRPLFANETQAVLLDPKPYSIRDGWIPPEKLPTNENQLSEFIWDQLSLPDAMRRLAPQFINAEKKEGAARATTEDGAKQWLQGLEDGLSYCWVVSSNPFVGYQQLVTEWMHKKYLPNSQLVFEGVGQAAPVSEYQVETAIGILLDNLARTLYTLQQIRSLGVPQ